MKVSIHFVLEEIKTCLSNFFLARIELGKNIFWSKLFLHLKSKFAFFFHVQNGTNDIEMDTFNNDSFEMACEAAILDNPICWNEEELRALQDTDELGENNIEQYKTLDDPFDGFDTNDQENFQDPNKRVLVEPSYIESVFLNDNNNTISPKSNLARICNHTSSVNTLSTISLTYQTAYPNCFNKSNIPTLK